MSVEVYKPGLKSKKSAYSSSVRSFYKARPVVQPVDTTRREVRPVYTPVKPRTDLVLGIEAMTHPDRPSFADLEALVYSELFQESTIVECQYQAFTH